jgi:hypothetical protein
MFYQRRGCGMHHNKLKGMIFSLERDRVFYSYGYMARRGVSSLKI